jgi:Predicted membrane protein (DUF2254)
MSQCAGCDPRKTENNWRCIGPIWNGAAVFHSAGRGHSDCQHAAFRALGLQLIGDKGREVIRNKRPTSGRRSSPAAVNDPTTAIQAIDRSKDILRRLARHDLEAGVVRDANGVLRLIIPMLTWEGLSDARFR